MRRLLTALTVTLLLTGMVSAAEKSSRGAGHPHRYVPSSLDGSIVQIVNEVDGRMWSAWSYRNGGEYDLALSVSSSPGIWSEPILLGLDDGLDQREPALAVDARGATYIAYGNDAGAIRVMALQPGESQWSSPVTVAMEMGRFSAPSLMVVGNALIVGYRDGDNVALHAMPLLREEIVNHMRSIYDGPDPTTGHSDDEEKDDAEASDSSLSGLNTNGGVTIRPVARARGDRED